MSLILVNTLKQFAHQLFIGVVPYLLIALLMQYLSQELRRRLAAALGVGAFVRLTAPGVVLHELCHAAACLIFGHRIVELRLFSPEADGTLGYVRHTYDPRSIYQRIGNFFIGVAPVCGGVLALYLLYKFLVQTGCNGYPLPFALFSPDFWRRWQSWLWLYTSISIASHLTLSRSDLCGALTGAVTLCVFMLIFAFAAALFSELQIALHSILIQMFAVILPPSSIAAVLMSLAIQLLPKCRKC